MDHLSWASWVFPYCQKGVWFSLQINCGWVFCFTSTVTGVARNGFCLSRSAISSREWPMVTSGSKWHWVRSEKHWNVQPSSGGKQWAFSNFPQFHCSSENCTLIKKTVLDTVGPWFWVFVYCQWCEENEMIFVSHEVPFPATSDRRSRVAGNGTE